MSFLCVLGMAGCNDSKKPERPPEDRFRKVVLAEGDKDLLGAIEFDFAPDGRIYTIHLSGHLRIFNPDSSTFTTAGKFDGGEYGLIGMKLDPHFENNAYIYLQYFIADTTTLPKQLPRRIMKISRFTIQADTVALATEKNYLTIPYEHECCHTGGGMDFDSKGNLYISTGDNTGAFYTQYSPTAILPDQLIDDGLRASGNTNDNRGKILRIHPEEDGSFSIPAGNLFPKGTPRTKPEIYIMGLRNPYRLFIDKQTDILYWGEVGPDAARDSTPGPRGYDEFNIARKAGNFGWPMVIADNKAYSRVAYAEKGKGEHVVQEKFDTLKLVNFSPNNTGLRDLPPSQPALIWYPYDSSQTFPILGVGGRTAIGGPVYRYDPDLDSKIKFPAYFDNCWFIADWMRDWVKVVHLNDNSDLDSIENFVPSWDLNKPMFMKFGPDGALYMLEYGTTWSSDNADVKLVRIEYIAGNRPPLARIKATRQGKDQLEINFSADSSLDYDGDALTYEWKDEKGNILSTNKSHVASFKKPGKYFVSLIVSDDHGGSHSIDTLIWAGKMPKVQLLLPNRTFYWDTIAYDFHVVSEKDEVLQNETGLADAKVFLQYLPPGSSRPGSGPGNKISGEVLLNESDCKACHHLELNSVGPSLNKIAAKYNSDNDMIPQLADKILNGGSGVWGNVNMSAHPQLTKQQAMEMVKYIYTLTANPEPKRELPLNGRIPVVEPAAKPSQQKGFYKLVGNYMNRAEEFKSLTFGDSVVLRSAEINAPDFDQLYDAKLDGNMVTGRTYSYACVKDVDFSGLKQIRISGTGPIEVRINSEKGPVIGMVMIEYGESVRSMSTDITPLKGRHDVYFVFPVAKKGFVVKQQLQQVVFQSFIR